MHCKNSVSIAWLDHWYCHFPLSAPPRTLFPSLALVSLSTLPIQLSWCPGLPCAGAYCVLTGLCWSRELCWLTPNNRMDSWWYMLKTLHHRAALSLKVSIAIAYCLWLFQQIKFINEVITSSILNCFFQLSNKSHQDSRVITRCGCHLFWTSRWKLLYFLKQDLEHFKSSPQ